MSLKGNVLISAFTLISVVIRALSCLLFFAPSLGLGNLLMHWKMGTMEEAKTSIANDVQRVQSLVYDVLPNGTIVPFTKMWIKVDSYEDMTFLSLGSYTKIFVSFLVIHFILMFGVKTAFSRNFRYIRSFSGEY